MTTKPPTPLSKSASALQVISFPPSGSSVGDTRTLKAAGGGVVSLVAPVLTYSIQALATWALGSQTAARGSPLNCAAGLASSLITAASHAVLMSTGLRVA